LSLTRETAFRHVPGTWDWCARPATVRWYVPKPLPEPESEQLAALLGDGTARLVYGLLYRRRPNPPTADEISYFLNAAASASMSADRVIRSLKTHFDIAEVVRSGGERYELRGRADQKGRQL